MRVLIGAGLLALAACGQQERAQDRTSQSAPERTQTMDVAEAPAARMAGAPGIAVTAAPGVAFTYDYDFRLPAERIADAQEAHAGACEKLGLGKCRITGMRYSLDDNGGIDAMLAFKLDPAIARAFGKQGIATVVSHDGMLTQAEISGNDAGDAITRIERQRADLTAERARIDRELARPGLTAAERAELQRQRAALDEQDRGARQSIGEQEDSLPTTPMTFEYRSGTAINAFGGKGMIARALDSGMRSINATVAILLTAIVVLGPPLLVLGGLFFGLRWLRRRYWPKARPVAESSDA